MPSITQQPPEKKTRHVALHEMYCSFLACSLVSWLCRFAWYSAELSLLRLDVTSSRWVAFAILTWCAFTTCNAIQSQRIQQIPQLVFPLHVNLSCVFKLGYPSTKTNQVLPIMYTSISQGTNRANYTTNVNDTFTVTSWLRLWTWLLIYVEHQCVCVTTSMSYQSFHGTVQV